MVKALILYTDGKREVKDIEGLDAYKEVVGGYIESLPITRGYVNPAKEARQSLLCYANEEGMLEQLPLNPYAAVLSLLGVYIHEGVSVYGNLILFSQSVKGGKKMAVDPYVVKLFDDFEACEDEDKFYMKLEALNKPKPTKKTPPDVWRKEPVTKKAKVEHK